MTNEEFFNIIQSKYNVCLETIRKKNADYTGKSSNPFHNFELSQINFNVPTEKGLLIRMMDKISRVNSLLSNPAQVKEEAITDTLDDLINYTAILKAFVMYKQKKDLTKLN
jgi:hypothetical protein